VRSWGGGQGRGKKVGTPDARLSLALLPFLPPDRHLVIFWHVDVVVVAVPNEQQVRELDRPDGQGPRVGLEDGAEVGVRCLQRT